LKRRFVATMECDRLLPVEGFFPQMAQTLDMRPRSVAPGLRTPRAVATATAGAFKDLSPPQAGDPSGGNPLLRIPAREQT